MEMNCIAVKEIIKLVKEIKHLEVIVLLFIVVLLEFQNHFIPKLPSPPPPHTHTQEINCSRYEFILKHLMRTILLFNFSTDLVFSHLLFLSKL